MSNVLVIDIGSQSMRGIIFDDKGNLLVKEQVKYEPHKSKANGFVEESADKYWEVLCQITRALRDKAPELLDSVIAMSVDTFRDTAVLLDKDNKPLRDCILWSDQRKAEVKYSEIPAFTRFCLGLVGMSDTVKAIRKKIKTRWIQQNEPELWSRVHKVAHISAYINYRLTGNLIDSYASTLGLLPFDYKSHKWLTKNALLYPVYEMPIDKMIEICNPGDEMGVISAEIAQVSGLPLGLKVIASGSDKGCETLGNGCVDNNVASVSFGTASSIQFSTKKYFEPEPFMPAYPGVLKGYYNPETQIFRGYWMISWFKKNFAEIFEERAKTTGRSVEELMDEEVANIPAGCDGLVLQPFWQAGLTNPEARGAIIGFSDFHSRAHMYRAIIEGIDFALREALERMERRGKQKIEYVTISGGGSQSDVICQIAADIFNRPVKRAQTYETTGLGAAMVTFISQGVFADEREAVQAMVRYTDTFTPNPQTAKVYDDIFYNIYLKMYRKLRDFYKHLEGKL